MNQAMSESLIAFMEDKKINLNNLVIAYAGPDVIFGERESTEYDKGFVRIKNPKRILKISQVSPAGTFSVEYVMIDWDFGSVENIEVKPHALLNLRSAHHETINEVLSLWMAYEERKVQIRAQDAGIITPVSPFSKIKK